MRRLQERYPDDTRDSKEVRNEIRMGLVAVLNRRMEGIEPTKLKRAGALAARTSLVQTGEVLGFKPTLSPKWDEDPEEAFQETFPVVAAKEKERHGALAGVFAMGVAQAVVQNAFKKVPASAAASMLRLKLNAQLLTRSRLTARNESNMVGNGVSQQVMVDSGIQQRRCITIEDERVCVTCLLDAARGWIPLDMAYPSGVMMAGDQHHNCRCYEEYRILPPCGDVPSDMLAKAIRSVAKAFQEGAVCTRPPSYMKPEETSPIGHLALSLAPSAPKPSPALSLTVAAHRSPGL